jgi:nucleoside-diphosphate-sugar epimerase
MRVLLAGASGAIGHYLVPQLIEAGHEVIGITRRPGSLAATGATERVADISDRAAFLAALDGVHADAVIHQLTALKRPPLTHRDMAATNRLRTEGTSTLIAAARRMGADRMVAASIFYGYGFSAHDTSHVDETDFFGAPDGRNDDVLRAVQGLEQQVRAFGGIVLRYGLIYDPRVKKASPVPRSWHGRLPLLHISDAAASVVSALEHGAPGEAYNIADDTPTSYRDLQTAIAKAAGTHAPIEIPDGVIRTIAPFASEMITRTRLRMSTEKAKRDLEWKPEFPSIVSGLPARTVRVTQAPVTAPTRIPQPGASEPKQAS